MAAAGVFAGPVGRPLWLAAVASAGAGGAVLLGLALMTVLSVLGRAILNQPLPGDFEIMENGIAAGVGLLLPYAQAKRGHVIVDFMTNWAPARWRRRLDGLAALLFAGLFALLLWRGVAGALDAWRGDEQTVILAWPIWPFFVPVLLGLALSILILLLQAWNDLLQRPAQVAA